MHETPSDGVSNTVRRGVYVKGIHTVRRETMEGETYEKIEVRVQNLEKHAGDMENVAEILQDRAETAEREVVAESCEDTAAWFQELATELRKFKKED